tara:strand:- start:3710 stop:3898 length:189 start_codon:yes stop_codon:yes gene_type:complete
MISGDLVFDYTTPCGQIMHNVCTVIDPLSENPGIHFPNGTFGMNGTKKIIYAVEKFKEELLD